MPTMRPKPWVEYTRGWQLDGLTMGEVRQGYTCGLPGTYAHGCRCRDCTEASRVARANQREKAKAS